VLCHFCPFLGDDPFIPAQRLSPLRSRPKRAMMFLPPVSLKFSPLSPTRRSFPQEVVPCWHRFLAFSGTRFSVLSYLAGIHPRPFLAPRSSFSPFHPPDMLSRLAGVCFSGNAAGKPFRDPRPPRDCGMRILALVAASWRVFPLVPPFPLILLTEPVLRFLGPAITSFHLLPPSMSARNSFSLSYVHHDPLQLLSCSPGIPSPLYMQDLSPLPLLPLFPSSVVFVS